jgi:hypothetical protein
MIYRILVSTRLALIVLAAAAPTVFTSSARAQSSCDLGFALTAGGVRQADLNDDGLTCEFNTIDSVSDVWTTFALDNGPPALLTINTCPDGFLAGGCATGVTPDRNGDSVCCYKLVLAPGQPHVIVIDNSVRPKKK